VRKQTIFLALLVLTTAFVNMPAKAAPAGASAGAGVVLQANRAFVSSDTAMSGASVFDGDALTTDNGGSLQVRFGNAGAYLLPKSSVVVHQDGAGFGATLTSGTVIVSSTGGEGFRLLADGATLRPASPVATTAQITMVSPTELNLISQKGSLEISMDGQVQTIAEGSSYRMVVEPGAPAGSPASPASPAPQGGANPTGSNHFLLFALILVGAGIGVGLWLALVSPSNP
jgi:hypothetical protein